MLTGQTIHIIKSEYTTRDEAFDALCIEISKFIRNFSPEDKREYKIIVLENTTILGIFVEEW